MSAGFAGVGGVMRRITAGLLLLFLALAAAASSAAELPLAKNLKKDARKAARAQTPILVFFAADSCPYCHQVEDLYLTPMYKSGDYDGKLLFRVVRIESANFLRDFNGKRVDHETFAENEGVVLTPVIRFYGPEGKELIPELIGYSTPDFYGDYLERAISDSISKLRNVAMSQDSEAFAEEAVTN